MKLKTYLLLAILEQTCEKVNVYDYINGNYQSCKNYNVYCGVKTYSKILYNHNFYLSPRGHKEEGYFGQNKIFCEVSLPGDFVYIKNL